MDLHDFGMYCSVIGWLLMPRDHPLLGRGGWYPWYGFPSGDPRKVQPNRRPGHNIIRLTHLGLVIAKVK